MLMHSNHQEKRHGHQRKGLVNNMSMTTLLVKKITQKMKKNRFNANHSHTHTKKKRRPSMETITSSKEGALKK